MILPGYQDRFPDDVDVSSLAVEGWDLVERPGFWAWYWRELLIPDDENALTEVWGADGDDIRVMLDFASWPVLRMDLDHGAELAVVFRNLEDDGGIDFLILPPGGGDAVEIAALDGHQTGPGLSWAELKAVAQRQATSTRRAQTLLLLAPAFGDEAADTPEAVALIAQAMRTLGATGDVEKVAEAAVSDEVQFWGHIPWEAGVPDGEYAPRNPAGAFALPEASRRLAAELLAPSRAA
ncbi:hypothetical protein JIG36_11065 [Actinoplanes sp. LDG1-06]|uniref:SMI1/KNR4 family protein n=1 Tax=Paractinoplanes ovalisporus TaxID=2810368 RepID=A0ABS2A8D2_9ACTN|nr:hypothetical protein [Actinoplanes ovalisporus]MBM2616096.1 hypothetical protein [Actinoplanes ovalisporus]